MNEDQTVSSIPSSHPFYCQSNFSHSQTQTNKALANVLLLQIHPQNVNLARKVKVLFWQLSGKPQAYLKTSVKFRSLGFQRMELISHREGHCLTLFMGPSGTVFRHPDVEISASLSAFLKPFFSYKTTNRLCRLRLLEQLMSQIQEST